MYDPGHLREMTKHLPDEAIVYVENVDNTDLQNVRIEVITHGLKRERPFVVLAPE